MSYDLATAAVAGAAIPQQRITYGPWLGNMVSKSADLVPRDYAAGGREMLYLPRTGTFKSRMGTTIKFDTITSGHETTGQLPAKFSTIVRQLDEFVSDSVTDSVPTMCALLTKEAMNSGLDDGRFSAFWWRDQVNNAARTLCDEYSTSGNIYPAPGSNAQQYYVVPAIWYDSGGGGLTRGTTEFARRYFCSGSRHFRKVGNWWHFPNLNGTPLRWNGNRATSTTPNRVMPTGPFPPTHAGSLANNSQQDNNLAYMRPTTDQQVGSWIAVGGTGSLASCIDEETVATSDFIHPPNDASNYTSRVFLSTPIFTPAADAVVTVSAYIANTGSFAYFTLSLEHHSSSTVIALGNFSPTGTQLVSFTLSPTQISQVTALTSDWSGMRLAFSRTVTSGSGNLPNVYWAAVSLKKTQSTEGGWMGKDTFYYSAAYRFEDGSVWMPVIPRGKNTNLTSGFNVFTVDSGNPEAHYQSVIWSNLPIGPYGTIGRILLRSPKIDITVDSPLQLVVGDLRVVWEIKDNVTTTYEDFGADDDSLVFDVDELIVRYDHIMAPRARYMFAGDSRAGIGYGGISPVAIVIAPVGRTTDYDLNLAENSATAFTQNSQYMRVSYLSGTNKLDLVCSDGTTAIAATTMTFTIGATTTLQNLVDAINATLIAAPTSSVAQWRAQVAPGANGDALATYLTPHTQDVASCVVSGQTITKAGATFSTVIAVGNLISGTGVTTGAYISSIDSDTQVTFVGTITAATKTLTFYSELGDSPTAATANQGYQRVISNAIPGFLYFNKSYLNQFPIEKSSVWLTVANPLSVKSAPNCFSGKLSNKHTPPIKAGIFMGGGPVDNGFVVAFSEKIGAIRNTRDFGTGLDSDYRLFMLNETRGCCSWQTVTGGSRCLFYMTPQGVSAADLFREIDISDAIYLHPRSDAGTGVGEFNVPLSIANDIAATAADNDNAYTNARVIGETLWVNYGQNYQIAYDFGTGSAANGLDALERSPGVPWGWSTRINRRADAIGWGRRSDGIHLYRWTSANQGSTGDGRIDEIETGTTDNGTALSPQLRLPWERMDGSQKISAQEVTVVHSTPSDATTFVDLLRGYQSETAATSFSMTMTVASGSESATRDLKMLVSGARAMTNAIMLRWGQSAGSPAEIKSIELRAKLLPSYK